VSSDTHTSVRQHIPSAAPATPRPSLPGRVTRPWSFQHPAHTRLPPCCEPWLCDRGTSGYTPCGSALGPPQRVHTRLLSLVHSPRTPGRKVFGTKRPYTAGKGSGEAAASQVARRRLRHPAPQLFRALTSNDQESTFPGDLIHHPSYTRNDHIKVPIAVRNTQRAQPQSARHPLCAANSSGTRRTEPTLEVQQGGPRFARV